MLGHNYNTKRYPFQKIRGHYLKLIGAKHNLKEQVGKKQWAVLSIAPVPVEL